MENVSATKAPILTELSAEAVLSDAGHAKIIKQMVVYLANRMQSDKMTELALADQGTLQI